jgi:hypothetical protein
MSGCNGWAVCVVVTCLYSNKSRGMRLDFAKEYGLVLTFT